jgi:Ulp1 family protease
MMLSDPCTLVLCRQVPQQENDYDCGLFVLYYMQRFIQEMPERLQKKDLPMASDDFITVSPFVCRMLSGLPLDV